MNKIILVLVLMILGHLLADFPLQGWLAQAKVKAYWKDSSNKFDYLPALICHAVMWGIITFSPIMYYCWFYLDWFWLMLPINILIHCIIDDLKANKKVINLCVDQSLHLLQIVITWIYLFLFVGVF